MSMITEKEYEPLSETREIEVHEDNLIRELDRRLGFLRGYDRYIANADGRPELQVFWRGAKSQEERNIDQLKQRIEQQSEATALRRMGGPYE